jgi:hypothetical protein
MAQDNRARRRLHPVYLCLLIPYIGLGWVPLYNRIDPRLFGMPFFYWYQILWIGLTAAALVPVYLYEERRGK